MQVFKPPKEPKTDKFSIFLAGVIDMGEAEDWQKATADALKDYDVALFNPRRDDWDSSWKQTIKNKEFLGQVTWEYDQLHEASLIFLNFTADAKAPISLMELGLFANAGKMIVCCPPKYWRRGNVEFICDKFKIDLHDDFESALKAVKKKIFAYGT